MTPEIDVSIVICTFSRAEMLRRALAGLMELSTRGEFRYEVVVVDNASTDDTPQVIAEAVERSPVPMRAVVELQPGISFARNCGINAARGEWIVFIDDDEIADSDWLFELLRMARSQPAQVIGGATILALPAGQPQPPAVAREMLNECYGTDKPRKYTGSKSPGTGNLLLHRKVLDEVGAFDVALREAGEDTDLMRRVRMAGIDVWYCPAATVRHFVPEYRLQAPYLRWSSHRTGWCFAYRDWKEKGLPAVILLALLRIGKQVLINFPKYVWALVRGDKQAQLGCGCFLWRCEAYVRCLFNRLSPSLFPQKAFFESLDFRSERQAFSNTAAKSPAPRASEQPTAVSNS